MLHLKVPKASSTPIVKENEKSVSVKLCNQMKNQLKRMQNMMKMTDINQIKSKVMTINFVVKLPR